MRRSAAWFVGALAVVAGGCGGSSGGEHQANPHPPNAAYDARLERAARAFSDGLSATLSIATRPRSPAAVAEEARRTRAALRAASVELATARPPRNVERDNRKVVAAIKMVGAEVAAYARAAVGRDWKAINQLNHAQGRLFDTALSAFEDLRTKGYRVGPLFAGGKSVPLKSCSGETVTAPDVIGQPEPRAVWHLREAGLDVTVFPQIKPNPRAPAGVVVHESPLNFAVCRGTPIWIIVSIGKA